jgi:CPA2 family monovalent cation:H+ antiporter-2
MDLSLLKDIVTIFALSTLVNLVFTRIKVPTVIGYLLTGIIAGPHLLKLVSGQHEIEIMAEVGVVFLLFTIGMEFSLKHLLKIRRIVFLGGLMQVMLTAGLFFAVSFLYGMDHIGGLYMGFLAALSSSALVLKLLQERSELTSNYGRTVLGILIFQDLLLVPLLLFANFLGSDTVNVGGELLILGLKAILIIGFVYAGNKWLLPKLLHLVAMTKNQELFMMSIFLICLAIALLTSQLGMSLAFGAFLAGLMISESEYSHNAFGNLIPFKDTFTSFFFVSIGMLLDLSFVIDNYMLVFTSVLLLIFLKAIIGGATGFALGHTFRGFVLIGLTISQVGEFSFILAKVGLDYSIISNYYYQLFLSVAVITMAMTPFLIRVSSPLSRLMLKLPLPKFIVDGLFPLKEIEVPDLKYHLVIIGKDSSALKLSIMATHYNLPHVSIIFDPVIAKSKLDSGEPVVYGDAVNEPILLKAHVEKADVVVISIGSLIPCMAIIEKVRRLNNHAHILVRSKHVEDIEELYRVGADQVFAEKLEMAIDLFNRVLVKRLYPQKDINRMLTHIRSMNLGDFMEKDAVHKSSILDELTNINISAIHVESKSDADGKSIKDLQLRKRTGVTILVIKRGEEIIGHPGPDTVLLPNDIAYVIGNPEQVNIASELFMKEPVKYL